jgi:hypothetical protein
MLCLLAAPFLIAGAAFDEANIVGSTTNEYGSEGVKIVSDGSGGHLGVAQFYGTAAFGATTLTSSGETDVAVFHMDSAGAIDWAVSAGGTDHDLAKGIAPDGTGGAQVIGSFRGDGDATFGSTTFTSAGQTDLFIFHVTSAGVIDWAIRGGGPGWDGGYNTITPDDAGGAIAAFSFEDGATIDTTEVGDTGGFGLDIAIVRVSATGTVQWVTKATHYGSDYPVDVSADGSGGAFMIGTYYTDPHVESPNATFGQTVVSGYGGSYDVLVLHVTSAGVIDWAPAADSLTPEPASLPMVKAEHLLLPFSQEMARRPLAARPSRAASTQSSPSSM